jgi:hypothetical protein
MFCQGNTQKKIYNNSFTSISTISEIHKGMHMDATGKFHSSTVATLCNSLNDTHTRTLYPISEAVTEEDTCREASPHLSVENQQPAWTQGNKATVLTTICIPKQHSC